MPACCSRAPQRQAAAAALSSGSRESPLGPSHPSQPEWQQRAERGVSLLHRMLAESVLQATLVPTHPQEISQPAPPLLPIATAEHIVKRDEMHPAAKSRPFSGQRHLGGVLAVGLSICFTVLLLIHLLAAGSSSAEEEVPPRPAQGMLFLDVDHCHVKRQLRGLEQKQLGTDIIVYLLPLSPHLSLL